MTAARELELPIGAEVPGVRVVYRPPAAGASRQVKPKRRGLEKNVEAHVDTLYAACGLAVVRFSQARASKQTEGIPDRKAYHEPSGVTFWLELKAPDGRQSADQRAFELRARRCGEVYILGGRLEAERALNCLGLGKHRPDGLFIPRPGGWRDYEREGSLDRLRALADEPNRYRRRMR